MRKLWVAILLAGCGGGSEGLDGRWSDTVGGLEWQTLEFRAGAQYELWAPTRAHETGAWSTDAAGLHLTPDGAPPYPAMPFALSGDHLRIWWPVHVLHEYDRQ